MPTLVIKNISKELHGMIRDDAVKNHRSMNRHVISILETSIRPVARRTNSGPIRLARPLTDEFLARARAWGRS